MFNLAFADSDPPILFSYAGYFLPSFSFYYYSAKFGLASFFDSLFTGFVAGSLVKSASKDVGAFLLHSIICPSPIANNKLTEKTIASPTPRPI